MKWPFRRAPVSIENGTTTPPERFDPNGITSDPRDPRLTRGVNEQPVAQSEVYLVLPEEAREEEEYVRPLRTSYKHSTCGGTTTMAKPIAQTYARNPKFYGATYCCTCRMHLPVGEFVWSDDGETVGS